MKNNNDKIQRSTAGKTTGSLVNYIMGNNKTLPEVGKGATILSWSDRSACEVLSVSKDGNRVTIQRYMSERTDNNGMSESQEYKYEKLDGYNRVVVWRYNSWYEEFDVIEYTKDYFENVVEKNQPFYKHEDFKLLYPNNQQFPILIEGKTHWVKKYNKINIIWGVKDEYYDYSF